MFKAQQMFLHPKLKVSLVESKGRLHDTELITDINCQRRKKNSKHKVS